MIWVKSDSYGKSLVILIVVCLNFSFLMVFSPVTLWRKSTGLYFPLCYRDLWKMQTGCFKNKSQFFSKSNFSVLVHLLKNGVFAKSSRVWFGKSNKIQEELDLWRLQKSTKTRSNDLPFVWIMPRQSSPLFWPNLFLMWKMLLLSTL